MITHPMQAGWLLRRGQLGEPGGKILLRTLKQIQRVTQGIPKPYLRPLHQAACWGLEPTPSDTALEVSLYYP